MIYIVEDDASIRELVVYTLNSQGMQAEGFALPSAFWRAMERQLPSLILLDIMLPEEDGLTILRRLRAAAVTSRLPVMMLTAKGGEYDKVLGLDAGADDYLPKPFGMMELLARKGCNATVICESAGTQAEDAKTMKDAYWAFMKKEA